MTSVENHELDVFISGELVDLSIPTSDFAENSNWYSWFNNRDITKFLEQGIYPNNNVNQLEFFNNISSDRLVLIITDKEERNIGVISLSFINHSKKSCDIALVVSDEGDKRLKPYISLEAMALMTTHAFDMLAIERVNAGQHIALAGWQNRLELLGYQLEGLHTNRFKKGLEVSDSMSIAVCKEDYDAVCKKRNGNLWDSCTEIKRRIKNFPRQTYLKMLKDIYNNERKKYYDNVFDL